VKKIVVGDDNRVGEFISKRLNRIWIPGEATTIGLEKDGKLVAGVMYSDCNGSNVCMHVAAEGKEWMTREYLWFCFYYPFEQLKVKRITGLVDDDNQAALEFDLHLGFKEEYRLKDAGKNGDLIILVMRKEDCRFLGIRHEKFTKDRRQIHQAA